jgi:hypothetical protein
MNSISYFSFRRAHVISRGLFVGRCAIASLIGSMASGTATAQEDGLPVQRVAIIDKSTSVFGADFAALFGPKEAAAGDEAPRIATLEFTSATERNTATRIQGWIVPSVTGRYRFGVAGDDQVDFLLGAAPGLAAVQSAARAIRWTGVNDFAALTGQISDTYELTAGERYAFELRHVQTEGASHFSVRWALEGQTLEQIPASCLLPWSAPVLDENENGIPDTWEAQTGLGSVGGPETAGWFSDADGDGIVNGEEWQLGGHPMVADAVERAGITFAQKWTKIPGAYVVDLKRSGFERTEPAARRLLRSLELTGEPGEEFGTLIRARIVPALSGEYTFWLSGDDTAELWLGGADGRVPLQLAARVLTHTMYRQWDAHPSQKSVPLLLTAGEPVFIEVLHKQRGGDNHVSVGWKVPGSNTVEVIPGSVLKPWSERAGDAGSDGIGDEWAANFVTPGNTLAPFEDPDQDGADNRAEFARHTNPLNAEEPIHGALLWERWTECPGNSISSLTTLSRFPAEPSARQWIADLDYRNEDTDYGCRLRGWITVPVSGKYAFDVAGDNAVQLWLGENASAFTRRLIADVGGWSGRRSVDAGSSQQAHELQLEEGQRYYLEVLHKQGYGDGHLSVRIRLPDLEWGLVPADWLQPWKKDSADADDDGLPDAWERTHGLSNKSAAATHGSWGDPDGDFLDNFAEYRLGTDPLQADADGTRGLVFWECWQGVYGDSLIHLQRAPAFPSSPSLRTWRTSLSGPFGFDDQYGSRMRVLLEPRKSGQHTFWLTGDNHCQLFLSTDDSKFNKRLVAEVADYARSSEWTKRPAQRSAAITLEAGRRYFLEVLHKEKWGEDHAAVSWQEPDGEEQSPIPTSCFIAASRDARDADDDDLPDDWEIANGLNAFSGGSDGASGDADGDGLTNAEEYRLGTGPLTADSDGDGLSDHDEVHGLRSNPLQPDAGALTSAGSTLGGAWANASTGWFTPARDIALLQTRRGQISWGFTLQEAGCWVLRLHMNLNGGPSEGAVAEALLELDGRPLDTRSVRSARSGPVSFLLITPWLEAGAHTLNADFMLNHASVLLRVNRLELLKPEGPATVRPGLPDWLLGHLAAASPAPEENISSLVSPFCLEGFSRLPGWVSVRSSAAPAGQTASPGVFEHWYSDVPLAADGGETGIAVAVENGALTHELKARWQPFNLRSFASYSIRAGDALRLTVHEGAVPSGAPVAIAISGPVNETLTFRDDQPAEFRFLQAGRYTLRSGTEGADDAAVCELEVLAADFGPDLLLYSGQGGRWDCPGLPHHGVLEADSRLDLREDLPPPETGRVLLLFARGLGERRILARISDTGPVMAAGIVRLSRFQTAEQGGHELLATLPDGTQLLRTTLVASSLPPGGYIVIRIIVGGVSFTDGSLERRLTAADFDADGIAKVDFFKAPGVISASCHRITVYDSAGRIVAEF